MPVGGLQHLPILKGDEIGSVAVVMPGEGDDGHFRPDRFQVGGATGPVVEVPAEPTPRRQVEQTKPRRQGPAQGAQPGGAFAHIVEEGRPCQVHAAGRSIDGVTGADEAVTLVGRRLGPEERGLPRAQQDGNLLLFGRGE